MWDRIAPIYDLGMKLLMLPFGGERAIRTRFLDAAGVAEGMRVLDIGCATGVLTRLARERVSDAGRAVGIDLAEGMVAHAQRAGEASGGRPTAFVCADAAQLPFPDESFDCVLSFMVLHELEPEARAPALRECHRVLAPGGCLAVADYAAASAGAPLLLRLMLKLFEPRWTAEFLRGAHLQAISSIFTIERTASLLGSLIHVTVARKTTGGAGP